jgi:asparagine synthase (glutamine-hydrolysing)
VTAVNETEYEAAPGVRFCGTVDFSAIATIVDDVRPLDRAASLRRICTPGLDVQWNAEVFDVAGRDGVVAIATRGAPNKAEALGWLDSYRTDDACGANLVDGGFAVVIVDTRRRRLQLIVDRFSIETLCYRFADGVLAFADTADGVPGSQRTLDSQSIYDYLYFHVIPAPRTVFADVRRVEEAQRIIVSGDTLKACRYWEPQFEENDRRDLTTRLSRFSTLMRNAVRINAADAKTACFLSGGTDSSTIAGMLSRMRSEPVHAYSIGFDAQGYDEMAYARHAARHFGLVHHEYYVTPDDLLDAIPKVAASFDQPFGNSSVVPAYYCALRAKQDGFERMLAGDGGDELFAGNSRYAMQKIFDVYQRLPNTLRSVVEPAAVNWRLFRRVPGFRQIGGYVRHSRVPLPDRLDTFRLLNHLDEEFLLEGDFRSVVDVQSPAARQRGTWHAIRADSLLNHMLAFDWKYTLADNDLPKVRFATQLAGVAVRYPFLSCEVVDFSLSLPPQWKLKQLKLRWFFKEALRDFLPVEILRKKKHGFGLPFGQWVVRHPGLHRFVEDSLEAVAARGIIRPQFTTELRTKLLPEAPGYYGEMAWLLMMLEQWLRTHDGTPKGLRRWTPKQRRT